MTQISLKYFRIFVPGILLILIVQPFLKGGLSLAIESATDIDLSTGFYLPLGVILGALYYISNVRKIAFAEEFEEVDDNIKDLLLMPYIGKENIMTTEESKEIRKSQGFLNTYFYDFVDRNESLRQKAKNVRFNGAIWTSFMDACLISIFGFIFYLVAGIVQDKIEWFHISFVLNPLILIFFFITKWLTIRHKDLSDDQIQIIQSKYETSLREKFEHAVEESRKQFK